MRFGLALPSMVVGSTQRDFAAFAERGERLGFDSLWVLDRLVFPSPAPLPLLAWVAGRTERVKLGTAVLLANLRRPLVLAKDFATIDVLSGGRLVVGLGVGAREEDYRAAGVPMDGRGRRLGETVRLMRQAWSGQPISFHGRVFDFEAGPVAPGTVRPGGPPLWLGGYGPNAIHRAARLGDGFVAGGGGPAAAGRAIPAVRQAAQELGRDLSAFPCSCLAYFSVSGDLERDVANVNDYMVRYTGRATMNPRESAVVGPMDAAVARIREFAQLELDTLILVPTTSDVEQVDRLAEVVERVTS